MKAPKKTTIVLKARVLKKYSSRMVLSPSWISNGHIAVRRTCVKNRERFATANLATEFTGLSSFEITDESMNRIFPDKSLSPWVVDTIDTEYGDIFYRSIRTNETAHFNPKYINMLGSPKVLYGYHPIKAFIDTPTVPEASFIIMAIDRGRI